MKIEIRTGAVERTDVQRHDADERNDERIVLSLWRRPWSDTLKGHDRDAEMVRVHQVTLDNEEAREVAAALALAARDR